MVLYNFFKKDFRLKNEIKSYLFMEKLDIESIKIKCLKFIIKNRCYIKIK